MNIIIIVLRTLGLPVIFKIFQELFIMTSNIEVFFSYAWGDQSENGDSREKIVDDLYSELKRDGYNVIRDKDTLGYRGIISDFMKRIGTGKIVVIVISQKYLQSPYCMFELYEIARNANFDKANFAKTTLPLIIEFVDFTRPNILRQYLDYWRTKNDEYEALLKDGPSQLSAEWFQRYDKIRMIHQNFSKLADWLIDINSLNPVLLSKDNFQKIKTEIQQETYSQKPPPSPKKFPNKKQKKLIWLSLIPLLVIAAIFFPEWNFKGIMYKNPEIIGDSIIQISFNCKLPNGYKYLAVSAALKDTSNFTHNYSKAPVFGKKDDANYQKKDEDIDNNERQIRTILQPAISMGEYFVTWPIKKKDPSKKLSIEDVEISFEQFDIDRKQDLYSIIDTKRFTFYNSKLHAFIASGLILGISLWAFFLFNNKV